MDEEEAHFGAALIEGLREAVAWRRGELVLDTLSIEPMPADRIRKIREKVAETPADFERRFGIPAAVIGDWEAGRHAPDVAARLLLKVIEADPEAVARVAASTI